MLRNERAFCSCWIRGMLKARSKRGAHRCFPAFLLVFSLLVLSPLNALQLVVHNASYAVRTDVGVGSFVNPDSFVLVYGCKDAAVAKTAEKLLASYTVFDIRWRRAMEKIPGLELAGFTQAVDNSSTPAWEVSVTVNGYAVVLLLFVDQDIQFDDPFGYLFLTPEKQEGREYWIEGIGAFKGQRVGKVTVSLR